MKRLGCGDMRPGSCCWLFERGRVANCCGNGGTGGGCWVFSPPPFCVAAAAAISGTDDDLNSPDDLDKSCIVNSAWNSIKNSSTRFIIAICTGLL